MELSHSDNPTLAVWYFAFVIDRYKTRRNMWFFYRVKDSRAPKSLDELIDQLKDAAYAADFKYGIKGIFQIEVARPKLEMRFKRETLLFAKIDFTGREPKVVAIYWNLTDPLMRRLRFAWQNRSLHFEKPPELVEKVPDLVRRDKLTGEYMPPFSASGRLHNQYESNHHRSVGYSPRDSFSQYATGPANHYYDKMYALRSATKPHLQEPTY